MEILEQLIVLFTLIFIEVVLGFDNIVVIAVLVEKLEEAYKNKARAIGLFLAYLMRVIFVIIALKIKDLETTVSLLGFQVLLSHLLFAIGGVFLIAKGTHELKEMATLEKHSQPSKSSFLFVVFQIMCIDLVFSFDSVLTAVALTSSAPMIIIAISFAIVAMYFASGMIASLMKKFVRLKILALLFVITVGLYLLLESFGSAFDRTYLFAIIAFGLFYEALCYRLTSKQ